MDEQSKPLGRRAAPREPDRQHLGVKHASGRVDHKTRLALLTDTENGDGGAIQDGDEGCRTLKRRKVAGDERPNDQRVGETCEIAKKGAAVPLLPGLNRK
jgi:hypothetical protein